MYEENRGAMVDALVKDLRRSKTEAILLEVDYLVNDLTNILNNFDNWVKPERVSTLLQLLLDMYFIISNAITL